MLSKEDRGIFIKMFRAEKYVARRLVAELPRKGWSLASVKRLFDKIDTTGSADRKTGSCRRRTARTDENVNHVEDHLNERLFDDWRRFDQNITDTAVKQWCVNVSARKRDTKHLI